MVSLMAEVEEEIGRKKEHSKRVKALTQQLAAAARQDHEYTVRKEHLASKRRFLQERIHSTHETVRWHRKCPDPICAGNAETDFCMILIQSTQEMVRRASEVPQSSLRAS
jgi:hypothetical protein